MATVAAPNPFKFYYDKDGKPLAGGLLYTYYSYTSVLRDTYKDSEQNTKNTNPIVLNDQGGCVLFVGVDDENTLDSEAKSGYRFVLYDSFGNLIESEDGIFAIKGKDGTNTGIIKYGPIGPIGLPGKSIIGKTGRTGPIGPKGENGEETHFWNEAGEYPFTVPNVNLISYRIGGGGAGVLQEIAPPSIQNVATGTAGNILTGTINVSPGDTLILRVGAGGLATTDQLAANGKSSSISGDNIATITAAGGTAGTNGNISSSQAYNQKLMPQFAETTFSGQVVQIIPNAIFGESTIFGEGGNVYKNGNPNATGNCASGGTSEPYLNTSGVLEISSYGAGAPGIIELSWVVNTQGEE